MQHTVARLVRVVFLRYYGNHSLRELETRLEYDLLYRWFAGGLFGQTPDRTTVWAFEKYMEQNHSRLYFDTVLRQLDAAYPNQPEAAQIGDTFAVKADAAPKPLIQQLCPFPLPPPRCQVG